MRRGGYPNRGGRLARPNVASSDKPTDSSSRSCPLNASNSNPTGRPLGVSPAGRTKLDMLAQTPKAMLRPIATLLSADLGFTSVRHLRWETHDHGMCKHQNIVLAVPIADGSLQLIAPGQRCLISLTTGSARWQRSSLDVCFHRRADLRKHCLEGSGQSPAPASTSRPPGRVR